MAKGLTIGSLVTVLEEFDVSPKEPAFGQGLKKIKPGRVGRIVESAGGRSFVVDFGGKRVPISSQRLTAATAEMIAPKRQRPTVQHPVMSESETQSTTLEGIEERETTTEPESIPEGTLLDFLNYDDPGFTRIVANMLLMNGNLPDTVLLKELRFVDLPEAVQKEIQRLVRAKLALH